MFFTIYVIQVILTLLTTTWGIKQYKSFRKFEKQEEDINSDKTCHATQLYSKLEQTWNLLGIKSVLFSFIPILGLLVVAFGIFAFTCDKKTITTLTNELDNIKRTNCLDTLYFRLPNNLRARRKNIEYNIEYLKRKNYHSVIADDSYQTLINLINDSVINDYISDESLELIRKAFDDLKELIDKLVLAQKQEEELLCREHQKFVNANFEKYEDVLSKISKDIDAHQSVFD